MQGVCLEVIQVPWEATVGWDASVLTSQILGYSKCGPWAGSMSRLWGPVRMQTRRLECPCSSQSTLPEAVLTGGPLGKPQAVCIFQARARAAAVFKSFPSDSYVPPAEGPLSTLSILLSPPWLVFPFQEHLRQPSLLGHRGSCCGPPRMPAQVAWQHHLGALEAMPCGDPHQAGEDVCKGTHAQAWLSLPGGPRIPGPCHSKRAQCTRASALPGTCSNAESQVLPQTRESESEFQQCPT